MISVLSPAFLWAGAALALVAVLLHFLARRPPSRRPLPTARFLTEAPRTSVRLHAVPRDLLVLASRAGFALALGAVFAGAVWTPARGGAGRIVMLDAGSGMAPVWDSALAAAERAASQPSSDEPVLILAYGTGLPARFIDIGALGSLETGPAEADYESALRALRSVAVSGTRLESVQATWVTRPRWSAFPSAFGLIREDLWSGKIDVIPVREPAVGGPAVDRGGGRTAPRTAIVIGAEPDAAVVRGLAALGLDARSSLGPGSEAQPADWVFAEDPAPDVLDELRRRASGGASVVVSGSLAGVGDYGPWRLQPSASAPEEAGPARPGRGRLVLPGGSLVGVDNMTEVASLSGPSEPGAPGRGAAYWPSSRMRRRRQQLNRWEKAVSCTSQCR